MKNLTISLTAIYLIFSLRLFSQSDQRQLIRSKKLELTVDTQFPIIKRYQLISNKAMLLGNISSKKSIVINGVAFIPSVISTIQSDAISYKMTIKEIAVFLTVKIEVIGTIVDFKLVNIKENGDFRVRSIAFPNDELLTVSSKEKNASFAGAKMFTAVSGNKGDIFQRVNNKTPLDSLPQGFLYGILSTKNIATSLWTNSVDEKTDRHRIVKQTVKKRGVVYTSLWSGSWVYRANRMKTTSELPHLKIVLTADANQDKIVDWQDGAIAFRKIMNNPLGADKEKDRVVFRIPMNFASQATNPFAKSLDETKRIYLNTDGLGQFVILKGYAGEGHDSNHPDYGYIGLRQGGVKGINLLCDQAHKYNAFIGVHINGTESYPEARMFSESLVDKKRKGWNWLDQSYYIDKRNDAIDNKRLKRLQSLKNKVPNLDFIYLDVWYAKGSWDSRKIAKEIHSLGWFLATEFPQDLEYDAIWNHWAVDYNYGGKKIKGFHSRIARFIRNHQKDTWIAKHPLLGGAEMADFEGWQGRINFDNCIDLTFRVNLPTKYLQHFPIIKWQKKDILFENRVEAKIKSGKRVLYKDGKMIYNDNTYLLPWDPIKEEKLYHWNTNGGLTNWELPNSWKNIKTVFLYKLSDLGKTLVKKITVKNGKVAISAQARQAYVLYKDAQKGADIVWGEGMLVKNGGFNSGDTASWKIEGKGATVVRDSLGDYKLHIEKGNETSVNQSINLSKGSYCAEVYVQTAGGRKATLSVKTSSGVFKNYTKSSLWKNYIGADSKHSTNMQRMYVFFDVAKYHDNIKLQLKTEKGASVVIFDDVSIQNSHKRVITDGVYFSEDFEHIPSGLYPFVKGAAGGVNDPRVHLSEKHSPYTQRGWNSKKMDDVLDGNWSLKLHENAVGLLIQTIPQNLRFKAGKRYQVSFKYQTEKGNYSFVLGDNNKVLFESKINPQHNTKVFDFIFTAATSGNSWFGIKKTDKKTSDFVLDDLKVLQLEE